MMFDVLVHAVRQYTKWMMMTSQELLLWDLPHSKINVIEQVDSCASLHYEWRVDVGLVLSTGTRALLGRFWCLMQFCQVAVYSRTPPKHRLLRTSTHQGSF